MSRCTHQFTRGSFEPLAMRGDVAFLHYRATCARCGNVVAQTEFRHRLGDNESHID